MATRGPTRQYLQGQCAVPPIENSKMLQFYFHCARQLLTQGEIYYNEGDMATTYVYLKRFMILGVDGIPNHNAFRSTRYKNDRVWLGRERERAMSLLEEVSRELDGADERNARAAAAASESTNWWDNIPEAPSHDVSASKQPSGSVIPAASHPIVPPPGVGTVPSVPPSKDAYAGGEAWKADSGHAYGHGGIVRRESMPLHDAFRNLSLEQDIPAGTHYPTMRKPESLQERPSMRPRPGGGGLSIRGKRRVVLPSSLVAQFEKIAQPNTDKPPYGIETCGILAGRLSRNVLEMTTLIIPKQEGTSDSCATTDEMELFNYMLENKLITLGWIHTHPKQNCFMSSVDVHTHCGYQLMLPEAVAVVYAPSDNKKRVGVYRLTEPEGMKLIQECKLKGFHVHPEGITIYEDAGMVWEAVPMKIVDLR